ncbi:MAG: cobalamin B12-binding domain-containing protein, partial [Solirubrobacteraceae bacterium]
MRAPARTGPSPTAAGRRAGDEDARRFARSFGDAIRVADGHRAEAVVDEALSNGLSAPAVHARVITPAMYRIGELWEQAVLTPADEHLATAMCQRILASLYPRLQRESARSRARMLLAGVEGQHHVLGLRMVADVLEGAGHDVLFLGADVPVSSLVEITRRHEPALVGLTATMPLGAGRLEEALYRLQQEVRRDLPILLGGQGVPRRLLDAGWPYAASSEDVVSCA